MLNLAVSLIELKYMSNWSKEFLFFFFFFIKHENVYNVLVDKLIKTAVGAPFFLSTIIIETRNRTPDLKVS